MVVVISKSWSVVSYWEITVSTHVCVFKSHLYYLLIASAGEWR